MLLLQLLQLLLHRASGRHRGLELSGDVAERLVELDHATLGGQRLGPHGAYLVEEAGVDILTGGDRRRDRGEVGPDARLLAA